MHPHAPWQGHTNIVTPEELVLTNHYLGLVMEFAPGGR